MVAQKLNLLHLLLLLSAAACLYYALWEKQQRTVILKSHFSISVFAIIAALVMMFFQAGMKQPIWALLTAMTVGLLIGGLYGLAVKLRVDRSWNIPRPAGSRNAILIAALLAAAVAVEIAGAVIGPDAKIWRFYAALGAIGCSGLLLGRAISLGVRVWLMIG